MPAFVSGATLAAVLAVGMLAPGSVLVALSGLVPGVQAGAGPSVTGAIVLRAVTVLALALAAATLTLAGEIGFLDGLAWAASLAAGSLFAPLVLALWWRRTTAWGAAAGIAAGAAITLYYILGTRYFAASFLETWSHLSGASEMALEDYRALKEAVQSAEPAERGLALAAVEGEARRLAAWWGLRHHGAGILGLPVSLAVTLAVSLATRRRAGEEA
jgi:cation/acetate symporter